MRKKFSLRKIVISSVALVALLLLFMFTALYFFQEKLLFRPDVLAKDQVFTFPDEFEEVYIPLDDNVKLHGLLFKAQNPKGLVFYLHGNGGSLDGWGNIAGTFTNSGYDLFMLDYRGYGKSGGHIESEEQMHKDISTAYSMVTKGYNENDIIVVGYSIGTGFAAHLAEGKDIKALILQAPYYSMSALIADKVPVVPEFVKRYKIATNKYLEKVTAPIYIFHGTDDRLIPYENAVKLQAYINNRVKLIPLPNTGHLINEYSPGYIENLKMILK